MATTLKTENLGPLSTIRRTWRTNLESPTRAPVIITAHREELVCTESGAVLKQDQNAGVISRSLEAVAVESVTLTDGTVITAAQVAEAVGRFLEKWDAEDRTPKPAPSVETNNENQTTE